MNSSLFISKLKKQFYRETIPEKRKINAFPLRVCFITTFELRTRLVRLYNSPQNCPSISIGIKFTIESLSTYFIQNQRFYNTQSEKNRESPKDFVILLH
jgi:hypothetical protein